MQKKQSEWHQQWSMLECREFFLFNEWIQPVKLEDFKDKEVLECGCGGGQHTSFIAPYAKEVVAIDLNTSDIAKKRNSQFENVTFLEADIAEMNLQRQFDIVFSIGVIHHADHPDKVIENLKRHVKPGGTLIIWVYSKEGNLLVSHLVEPIRKKFLVNLKRETVLNISKIICALMYIPIYTIYFLPLYFLPYYQYFQNFRKLSFMRNVLNIFDKLNAPQVDLISKNRIESWFNDSRIKNSIINFYKGVSWTGVGQF